MTAGGMHAANTPAMQITSAIHRLARPAGTSGNPGHVGCHHDGSGAPAVSKITVTISCRLAEYVSPRRPATRTTVRP